MYLTGSVLHRLKSDTSGKLGVWGPQWGLGGVVSPGSGGLIGVQEHRPDTAIKAQHGCLAKMNTGSNFGCSVCRGAGKSTSAVMRCHSNVRKTVLYTVCNILSHSVVLIPDICL